MFWRFYSKQTLSKTKHISMESLLKDYERELNPPPTCWEYIKHLFQK
jgi:hypothetical protein